MTNVKMLLAVALVQTRASRYADTAALYQALGGGWWNRDDEGKTAPAKRAVCKAPKPLSRKECEHENDPRRHRTAARMRSGLRRRLPSWHQVPVHAICQRQGGLLVSLRAGLIVGAAMLLSGCAGTCRATDDKLAALPVGLVGAVVIAGPVEDFGHG